MKYKIRPVSIIAVLFMVIGLISCFTIDKSTKGKTYKIGDRGPGGGYVFYDKGNSKGGWRYLEAAPKKQGKVKWSCYKKSIPGARGTAIGNGKANTAAIIKACGEAGIAAKVAAAYRGGGKRDWFLPSKDELNLMYENVHKAGVGGFINGLYWSSSESFPNVAWYQIFSNGSQSGYYKTSIYRVRAVRAF